MAKLRIEKRGAEYAFAAICSVHQSRVESVMPEMVQQPCAHIANLCASAPETANNDEEQRLLQLAASAAAAGVELCAEEEASLGKYQELVNCLTLVEHMCSCGSLHESIVTRLVEETTRALLRFLAWPLTGVRHLAARSLAAMCAQQIVRTMSAALESTLDALDNSDSSLCARQGALEFVHCLFERLGDHIVPFTVILIVPVLKRM